MKKTLFQGITLIILLITTAAVPSLPDESQSSEMNQQELEKLMSGAGQEGQDPADVSQEMFRSMTLDLRKQNDEMEKSLADVSLLPQAQRDQLTQEYGQLLPPLKEAHKQCLDSGACDAEFLTELSRLIKNLESFQSKGEIQP